MSCVDLMFEFGSADFEIAPPKLGLAKAKWLDRNLHDQTCNTIFFAMWKNEKFTLTEKNIPSNQLYLKAVLPTKTCTSRNTIKKIPQFLSDSADFL